LQDKIEELKSNHQTELENVEDKLINQKEAAILEVKSEYQERIEKIRKEKNGKIESLMGKLESEGNNESKE